MDVKRGIGAIIRIAQRIAAQCVLYLVMGTIMLDHKILV